LVLVLIGLGLGLAVSGLGLSFGLAFFGLGLGLELCGLVNISARIALSSNIHRVPINTLPMKKLLESWNAAKPCQICLKF